ncbi:FliG C-terminal domain-containing protein [Candidatus Riflebacteria bacterium]
MKNRNNKFSKQVLQKFNQPGGLKSLIDILAHVDVRTKRNILQNLEIQDPTLAEEIKRKLFLFEDIILVDDRGMQRLIKNFSVKELALGLKGTIAEVKDKFLSNMSRRMVNILEDEMVVLGRVKKKDVEDMQQRIIKKIMELDAQKELLIMRPGEEYID